MASDFISWCVTLLDIKIAREILEIRRTFCENVLKRFNLPFYSSHFPFARLFNALTLTSFTVLNKNPNQNFPAVWKVQKQPWTNILDLSNATKKKNQPRKPNKMCSFRWFVDLGYKYNTFYAALFWIFVRTIGTVILPITGKRNMYAGTITTLELMTATRNWIQSLQFIWNKTEREREKMMSIQLKKPSLRLLFEKP